MEEGEAPGGAVLLLSVGGGDGEGGSADGGGRGDDNDDNDSPGIEDRQRFCSARQQLSICSFWCKRQVLRRGKRQGSGVGCGGGGLGE